MEGGESPLSSGRKLDLGFRTRRRGAKSERGVGKVEFPLVTSLCAGLWRGMWRGQSQELGEWRGQDASGLCS